MNCKQGDLAWVVLPPNKRHTAWGRRVHMAIVTCEKLFCNEHTGAPMWYTSPIIKVPCGCGRPDHEGGIEGIADKCLRPIRDLPPEEAVKRDRELELV